MIQLPLRTDGTPHYSFEVSLDGESFTFEFRWNVRGSFWVFDIADSSGAILITGRKVVLDFPLLSRFAHEDLPLGQLSAVDTTGEGVEPTREDFGTRVLLVYRTLTEVQALAEEG